MKKTLILAVARPAQAFPARPLAGNVALFLWRLRALGRCDFSRNFSPVRLAGRVAAKRFHWKDTVRQARPGWLVIAVRGFARSYRSHPVKIQFGSKK